MDQTGLLYLPGFQFTYEEKGQKQVTVVGKDEKRGYTLYVATAADGSFLTFRQDCGGKTRKSTPEKTSKGHDESTKMGFNFTFAASKKKRNSNYSTLKLVKDVSSNFISEYLVN